MAIPERGRGGGGGTTPPPPLTGRPADHSDPPMLGTRAVQVHPHKAPRPYHPHAPATPSPPFATSTPFRAAPPAAPRFSASCAFSSCRPSEDADDRGPDLPPASAWSHAIRWSRVLPSQTRDAAGSYRAPIAADITEWRMVRG